LTSKNLKAQERGKVEYILNPVYFDEKPIGFFDGAVVNDKWGVGIYIKLRAHHGYKAFFHRRAG
jgi:hypothetical protein